MDLNHNRMGGELGMPEFNEINRPIGAFDFNKSMFATVICPVAPNRWTDW